MVPGSNSSHQPRPNLPGWPDPPPASSLRRQSQQPVGTDPAAGPTTRPARPDRASASADTLRQPQADPAACKFAAHPSGRGRCEPSRQASSGAGAANHGEMAQIRWQASTCNCPRPCHSNRATQVSLPLPQIRWHRTPGSAAIDPRSFLRARRASVGSRSRHRGRFSGRRSSRDASRGTCGPAAARWRGAAAPGAAVAVRRTAWQADRPGRRQRAGRRDGCAARH